MVANSKLSKNKWIKACAAALLSVTILGACSGRNAKDTGMENSDSNKTTQTTTKKNKEPEKKPQENKYESINDAAGNSDPEKLFKTFLSNAKKKNYAKEDSTLVLVLYKPDCPDCKEVENFISQKVLLGQRGASSASDIEGFKYNSIAVNIEESVPDWIQSIKGLSDEGNVFHVPAIAVVSLKSSQGTIYWELYKNSVGANKDSISNALQFYIDPEFQVFLDRPVHLDVSSPLDVQ